MPYDSCKYRGIKMEHQRARIVQNIYRRENVKIIRVNDINYSNSLRRQKKKTKPSTKVKSEASKNNSG